VSFRRRFVTSALKFLTGILCRVHDEQVAKVPHKGPLIVISNHVNFLDVPLVFPRLMPRPLTGFVKAETWDNPFLRWLFTLWDAIPIRRGEVDRQALRQALSVLKAGGLMGVAAEGTRSGDGKLQKGRSGVVMLALLSGAPMLPLVFYGAENYQRNLKRLRRNDFHIVVGDPFFLLAEGTRERRQVRDQMVDEIMYQLAALLPEQYRGVYANLDQATETYLRFPPGSKSNLLRARESG
jgi:1-acyl-sn-glycerol-3-phosphate acyltransferase